MKKIRFDSFIKLNRGFDLPDSQIEEGIYPVVASTSIKAYHNEYKVEGPMVTTGRSGSLGKVVYIEGKCWPLNTTLYVKDFKGNVPRYVYYYLQMMHLEQFNAGVGVPTLNQNHLHSLKILVHKKEQQQKIASILSTYDTLIENNTKRIRLLEQMAENLYKEWFVRFRFPGHENVEMENGLPKGWKNCKVKEIYDTSSGGTPSRNKLEYFEGGNIPWIKTGELQDCLIYKTEERITDDAVKHSSAKMIPSNSLVMAMYGVNIGKLGITTIVTTCNQACCVFKEKKYKSSRFYLFHYFKSIREYLLSISFGAAQQNLSQELIKNIKIIVPDEATLKAFEKKEQLFFNETLKLELQNQLLTRQRDLLLPRLMSGKLEVTV